MKKFVLKRQDATEGVRPPGKTKIDYERVLNPAQFEAVTTIEGAVLVIAGAGTGKTTTLVHRVAYLVECGVPPENILLMTFTRKSADEMMRRAATLLDGRCERVVGGTFHSYCNAFLRRNAQMIGFERSFTILDQGDAQDVVSLLRTQLFGKEAEKRRFPKKSTLYGIMSKSLNTERSIRQILESDYAHYLDHANTIERLRELYDAYKVKHQLMDYDDLLLHTVAILQQFKGVRDATSAMHKYIMVDEYQDTNAIQRKLVTLISSSHSNVMVVGDDSQSIYSFRGANFRNIMEFPDDFPGARVITIEENYRSTQPILSLTNRIIDAALEKYPKNLFTHKGGGVAPAVVAAHDESHQSQFVAQRILELREEGTSLNDIAVLFRSGFMSFDLEIELARAGIPFVKFGGMKFVEAAHVKDIISHLRILENPRDAVSWHRILLLLDGIGPKKAHLIIDDVMSGTISIQRGAEGLPAKLRADDNVAPLFELLRRISGEGSSVVDKIAAILEYYRPLLRAHYDDHQKRQKDLDILQNIAERYRSAQSFLADMALEPPSESQVDIEGEGTDDEKLTLSTIHSAKGLEWHTVFLIYALDGMFPSTRAANSQNELEEERRLMYVACTRAKVNLTITYPMGVYDRESGMTLTKPSRFIDDLPEDIAERWVVTVE
jgi:DNA helicase-2/ATP-dependent DNA helicase PcrA